GDSPAARVKGEAATPAAPARRAVELHGDVAQLPAEPRRAAHEAALEHDPGAEAGPGRQHDQRARAPAGAEHPFAERERVDVVVHERRPTEPLRELGGERAASELWHVGHVLADPADGRVDGPG